MGVGCTHPKLQLRVVGNFFVHGIFFIPQLLARIFFLQHSFARYFFKDALKIFHGKKVRRRGGGGGGGRDINFSIGHFNVLKHLYYDFKIQPEFLLDFFFQRVCCARFFLGDFFCARIFFLGLPNPPPPPPLKKSDFVTSRSNFVARIIPPLVASKDD